MIAFSERTRHLLSQCDKGQMLAVTGNGSRDFYESRRSGETVVSRTIIVEGVLSAAGSLQRDVPHPADIDPGLKSGMEDALSGVLPERQPTPPDGVPDLD